MTDEQLARAKQMREEGMIYREIGKILDMSYSSIYYYLNPAYQQHCANYSTDHQKEMNEKARRYRATHKEKRRKYREVHQDERMTYNAKYRAEHREELRRKGRKYYADHKEKMDAYGIAYYAAHKKDKSEYCAQYYIDHKKERSAYNAKYRSEHKERGPVYCATRRALLLGATIGNGAEIAEIYRRAKEDLKVRCYLCGKLIPKGHRHVDHIMPLSKGGSHRPSNLAVACDKCNQCKFNKLPNEVGVLL